MNIFLTCFFRFIINIGDSFCDLAINSEIRSLVTKYHREIHICVIQKQ